MSNEGRVLNSDGEVLVSGTFEINRERQEVTLHPFQDTSLLDKASGPLILELDDGRMLELSSKYLRFRLYEPDGERRSIYRLHYVQHEEAEGLPVSR